MKNSNSLKKIIVLLLLIVIAFTVLHYLFYKDIKTKNEEISNLKQELFLQESRQDYLVSTQKLIDNLASSIKSVDDSIVASDGDVSFIESLESVAKNNGLGMEIDSLSFEENAEYKTANVSGFKIKASTSGSWAGTYSFLAELETLPVKVKINRFSIANIPADTNPDTKKPSQIWKTNFDIIVLKYK